jgi:tetratricopeptide (TPR) repeat protein
MMRCLSFFIFMLITSVSFSQSDSLYKIWLNKKNHDTVRLNAFEKYIHQEILFNDPDSAFKLAQTALSYSQKKKYRKQEAEANNIMGISKAVQGDLRSALNYFNISLEIREKSGDENGVGSSLNNKGLIYSDLGENKLAIEMFKRALKIYEKRKNYKGINSSLANLGITYHNMGDFRNAIQYYSRSLKLSEQKKDLPLQGTNNFNIGTIHFDQQDYENALIYFNRSKLLFEKTGNDYDLGMVYIYTGNIFSNQKKYKEALKDFNIALEIKEKVNDLAGTGIAYGNIGTIFRMENQPDSALKYYELSLKYSLESENMQTVVSCYNNIGNIYFDLKNYSKAREYSEKSLQLAQEKELAAEIKNAAESLWKIYKITGDNAKAFFMFELFINTRDTLESESNKRAVMAQEFKYQYEKQFTADSIKSAEEKKVQDAEIARQDAEIKAKKIQQFYLFGGLALVVVFALFIFNRFRVTQKQNKIIEEQKHLVEEKQKEILDSINYAKRIQQAILPNDKTIASLLPDSFILYKPKDIVAGDFYWMEVLSTAAVAESSQKKLTETANSNYIYLAAADCTGHGVPGAMVSVVCSNALTKSLLEEGITETGKILDRTRELVIEKFSKSEENVRDGMDISILKFQISNNEIEWSGANNPLWIIRNGVLLEYKPDKQPIGKYEGAKPFTTHTIEILKGDTLYIFTDGLQDQFGGNSGTAGKKFKKSKLKELLLSVQNKSMNEQKIIIDETFEKWRGDLEQNDDVCIIGVKL